MNKKNLLTALFTLALGICAQQIFAQTSGIKPELIMYRHNGGPGLSPLPVLQNDMLGNLKWNGLTAINAIRTGASIQSFATGPVSAGSLAANLVFRTNNGTEEQNRMVITSAGLVGIGTMAPDYHLHVVGNTHTSGNFFGRIHFDKNQATNDAPNTYFDEAYFELKNRSVLTGGNSLPPSLADQGGVLSLAPGGTSYDHQLFFGDDGIWNRIETGNNAAWTTNWYRLLTSKDINGTKNFVSKFTDPNSLGDSQLFDDGTNVGIGVGNAPDAAYKLTVGGSTRVNGSLNATNNLNAGGDAGIAGTTTTGSLSVTNNGIVGGTLTANALVANTNANVGGNTSTGSLSVSTNASVGGTTTTSGLQVNTNARVNGTTRLVGKVSIGPGSISDAGTHALYVGGSIIAEEVKVALQTNWPDYVFADNYPLAPLAEVEKFVQQQKHLPGIRPASDIEANGLGLGETTLKQQEKIEEIYLYLFEMEKRIKQLEAENAALKAKAEQH
jgi:cytoskeletal protein CcmA (bactofilin family)